MNHHRIRLTIAVLFLFGVLEFDVRTQFRTQYGDTKSAVAAPIDLSDECRTVGQIDRLEGEGSLLREGMSETLTPGKRLCAGDRVQLTANARAMAMCSADGTTRSFPVGMQSLATSVCPGVLEECKDPESDPNSGCGRNLTEILEPNLPHILSPRNTVLLTTQPQIRWEPVPGASRYTVTLENAEEAVWGPIEVEGTEIAYGGDIPLAAGPSYTLTVTADNGSQSETRFHLLDESDRDRVMQLLAMQPTDETAVIPPQVYVYADNDLFSEAIEILEMAIDNGNRSAAIYLQLGQLYNETGLSFKAEEAYWEAIELATTEGNLKGQALAHTRLGQLYRDAGNLEAAIDRFSQAQMLYEQAGELDLAREVEALLQKLQPSNN
ncbi:MAG: tetratricopeptide repeat protein [Geitlerinemataceae cyanobacterium]